MADKKDDDLFRRHRYINTQLIQATLQYEGRGVKYHSSDQDLEVGGLACHSSNRVVSMEARCRAVDRGVVHGAVQVGDVESCCWRDDCSDQLLPLLVLQPAQQLAHGSGLHAGEGVGGGDISDSDVDVVFRLQHPKIITIKKLTTYTMNLTFPTEKFRRCSSCPCRAVLNPQKQ